MLLEKLCCAGIAFFSEDKLREEGFFKTPDVKLEVWIHACLPCLTPNNDLRTCLLRNRSSDSQWIFRVDGRAAQS